MLEVLVESLKLHGRRKLEIYIFEIEKRSALKSSQMQTYWKIFFLLQQLSSYLFLLFSSQRASSHQSRILTRIKKKDRESKERKEKFCYTKKKSWVNFLLFVENVMQIRNFRYQFHFMKPLQIYLCILVFLSLTFAVYVRSMCK